MVLSSQKKNGVNSRPMGKKKCYSNHKYHINSGKKCLSYFYSFFINYITHDKKSGCR